MRKILKSTLIAVSASALIAAPATVVSASGGSGPVASVAVAQVAAGSVTAGNVTAPVRAFGRPLQIVGLVAGTSLVDFTSSSTRTTNRRTVTGLLGDRRLVGIDYRVQDGGLYGVGDAGGIYTISRLGRAAKVKQLTVPLAGTSFGVDFNPAANALRVISDTGQNLRQPFADPAAVTVADTPLAYTPGAAATGITGAAYTNNDDDAGSATTLYDLDTTLDQVSIQSPANAGSLAPTGKTRGDIVRETGFDIYSKLSAGVTVDLTGYATVTTATRTTLYLVTLFTGKLRAVGTLDRAVTDIAIPLAQG